MVTLHRRGVRKPADRAKSQTDHKACYTVHVGLDEIDAAIERGKEVAAAVAEARRAMRWRVTPGDPTREDTIAASISMIDDAMRPIRSAIGKLVWEPLPARQERALRETSKALQYERRQLKKMRR